MTNTGARANSHDGALRVLSNRLVGILSGYLRSRILYDPAQPHPL
jgi:hypothetical protein